jgi:DNA-binding response OmpR family regulator
LELKARIKAILRRSGQKTDSKQPKEFISGELEVHMEARRAFIKGAEVNLTAKEFDLLGLFMNNPQKVYNRENLRDLVWENANHCDIRTVDVHIRRLREKIEEDPSDPKYILTKWSVGYYFR